MKEGLRLYNYYSEESLDNLKIDDDRKRFYFLNLIYLAL